MHEGYWSTTLGLRGWPAAGEEMIVARNILLAELTGARVHCQHLSSAGSVNLLRAARQRGLPLPMPPRAETLRTIYFFIGVIVVLLELARIWGSV